MNSLPPSAATAVSPMEASQAASAGNAVPSSLGERLRVERERRGLSVQKAADQMHLDGWVIEALESEDYSRIGPAVFAKGHLRKYAANLGLPVKDFLDGFEARGTPIAAAEPVAENSPGWQRATVAVVVVAAIAAAGLWVWKPWQARVDANRLSDADAVPAAQEAASSPAAESDPVSPGDPVEFAPQAAAAAPQAAAAVGTPAVIAPTAPSAAAPVPGVTAPGPGAGRARMRLSFSADSHVEVRDATGKVIFSGTGYANSMKQVSGAAPMHVYLSDAGGVQLEINDRTVAIGAKFLSGSVAHFDAGADGVLRRDTAAVAEQRPRG